MNSFFVTKFNKKWRPMFPLSKWYLIINFVSKFYLQIAGKKTYGNGFSIIISWSESPWPVLLS